MDADAAEELAGLVVSLLPNSEAAREDRWRSLDPVTEFLADRYGRGACGWNWSVGEGDVDGGVVEVWCCASDSVTTPDATAPLVVEALRPIWDNLTGHVRDLAVRAFLRENADWPTVYRLPGYAPELNPAEGLWGELENGPPASLTARNLDEVTTAARHALRRVQYQPDLLNGFLAETGLATD